MYLKKLLVEINYDDYFNKLLRINHTGTIWNLYKPLNEKSLYGQIVSDPANVQVSLYNNFSLYKKIKCKTAF